MSEYGYFDDPNPPPARKRESSSKVKASPEQEEALRCQLAKLIRWEQSNPTYQEMLALVEARRRDPSQT